MFNNTKNRHPVIYVLSLAYAAFIGSYIAIYKL